MLEDKYGAHIRSLVDVEGVGWPRTSSLWWKDLMSLKEGVGLNWFNNGMMKKVGNGRKSSFWLDKWAGDKPLCAVFPRIFSMSNQKEALVSVLVEVREGEVHWNLVWRRYPFNWEIDLVNLLLEMLQGFNVVDEEDVWWWRPEEGGVFSVRSSYLALEDY